VVGGAAVDYSRQVLNALGVSEWPPKGLSDCSDYILYAYGPNNVQSFTSTENIAAEASLAVASASLYVDGGELFCVRNGAPRVPAAVLAEKGLGEIAGATELVPSRQHSAVAASYPVALLRGPSLDRLRVTEDGSLVLALSGAVERVGGAAAVSAGSSECRLPGEWGSGFALAPVFNVDGVAGEGVPGLLPDPGARPGHALVDAVVSGGSVRGASLWSGIVSVPGFGVPVACNIRLSTPSLDALASHLGRGRVRLYRLYSAEGVYFVVAGEAVSEYESNYAVVLVEAPSMRLVSSLAASLRYSVAQPSILGRRHGLAILSQGGGLEDAEEIAAEVVEKITALMGGL